MEYDVDTRALSTAFAAAYPAARYPELMFKQARPYTCLLVQTHDDFIISIPFRSHIRHKNAFLFKGTRRSLRSSSGLDYSKIVILKDESFVDPRTAIVDKDEYNEVAKNLGQIIQDATEYVDTYIDHVNGTAPLHPREFQRRYGFSTLPYFHAEMNLPTS